MDFSQIDLTTNYGITNIFIKPIMDKYNLSIYRMSKLTGLKYEIVKKYYNGLCYQYDRETISKFCYVLKCDVSDILKYNIKTSND